jgi:CDGSH-type Zn-finger protein
MAPDCAAEASKAWSVTQDVVIKVRENGPYLVRGPVTLTDADGNPYTIEDENVALCRCGGSQTKPFCDGSHRTNGFTAAQRAVSNEAAE